MDASALALHALSAVVWVGGMFFAYMALRPAAAEVLAPPQRLRLWRAVLGIFLRWVWVAVILLVASGLWLIYARYGGLETSPHRVQIMLGLALVMIGIFLQVFFVAFRRLVRDVEQQAWDGAGRALVRIRRLVAGNLVLGLATVAVASGGRLI